MRLLLLMITASSSLISQTGFTLMLLVMEENLYVNCLCTTFKNLEGFLETKCRDLNLRNIPSDINPATEILDLSDNDVNLQQDDFKPFATTLITLNMSGVARIAAQAVKNPDLFEMLLPLGKLLVLDMSRSDLQKDIFYLLPKNLRTFFIDGNLYEKLEISDCPNLLEVSVTSNRMVSVPTLIGPPAPIEILRLADNPLTELTPEAFAPFCSLLVVDLRQSELHSVKHYCRCRAVKQWLNDYTVKGHEDIECNSDGEEGKCNINFNEAIRIRQSMSCPVVDKSTQSNLLKWIYRVFILSILGMGILVLVYQFFGLEVLFTETITPLEPSTTVTPKSDVEAEPEEDGKRDGETED